MHRKAGASTLMCLWWSRWVLPPGPECVHVASTLTVYLYTRFELLSIAKHYLIQEQAQGIVVPNLYF